MELRECGHTSGLRELAGFWSDVSNGMVGYTVAIGAMQATTVV